MSRKWKASNGISYRVSDEGYKALTEESANDRLARQTAVNNFDATIRALDGFDPKTIFGPALDYDKLKFSGVTLDTCGCFLEYIWHAESEPENRVWKAHRTLGVCAHHAATGIHKDRDAHHMACYTENWHKNNTSGVVAALAGVDPAEITFGFNDKRELVLHHEKLTQEHIDAAAKHDLVKHRPVHLHKG